jgi:hypothetical protein
MWMWTSIKRRPVSARAVRISLPDAAAVSPAAATPARNFLRGIAAGAGALQQRQPRMG